MTTDESKHINKLSGDLATLQNAVIAYVEHRERGPEKDRRDGDERWSSDWAHQEHREETRKLYDEMRALIPDLN